jgi:hypothetical protein
LPPSSIGGVVNLTKDTLTPGRPCGEAPQFVVRELANASATLASSPGNGCLGSGDEVLLISLQGTQLAYANVGNWELLTIAEVTGPLVRFAASKQRNYGAQPGSDLGVGLRPDDQRVALIRVPHFGALTVPPGAVFTAAPWNGATGGVVALRAGSLRVEGTISAAGLGYRPGRWSQYPNCRDNLATEAGESVSGLGLATTSRNVGGSGGLSAVIGTAFGNNTPINATAGHAFPGEPGLNPNGRTIGEAGAAYGVDDGTRLTMGSGAGGNLTCSGDILAPRYVEAGNPAGGIVLILAGDVTVTDIGSITASAPNFSRDVASSGGYVLLRGSSVLLGDRRVTAVGANAIGDSEPTIGITKPASPGYVVIQAAGTLSGTTMPRARHMVQPR